MAADEYNGSPDEAIFEITHARSGFQRKWRRRLAQRTDSADVVHSTLMEKTMDISEYKQHLLVRVEGDCEFRNRKAEEYPEDEPNRASAEALGKLYKALSALPLNHPALVNCHKLEPDEWNGSGDEISQDFVEESQATSERLFGRYGFDSREDGNAEQFLGAYLTVLQSSLRAAFRRPSP